MFANGILCQKNEKILGKIPKWVENTKRQIQPQLHTTLCARDSIIFANGTMLGFQR